MQDTFSKTIFSLDGGATSSKYGIIVNNKLIKNGIGKPLYTDLENKIFIQNLLEIIKSLKLRYKIDYFIFGISGIDTDKEQKRIEKIIEKIIKKYFPSSNIKVTTDIDLVLLAGSEENKIAVIAGTGTNCVGVINEVRYKSGGLGKDLADQGSGYWIAKKALEMAIKSYDSRGQKTMLESELVKFFKVKEIYDLKNVVASPNFSKTDFASVVPLVNKCAKKNDAVSIKILEYAGVEIALHVISICRQSNSKNAKIYAAGSIFKIEIVRDSFEKNISNYISTTSLTYLRQPTFAYGVKAF